MGSYDMSTPFEEPKTLSKWIIVGLFNEYDFMHIKRSDLMEFADKLASVATQKGMEIDEPEQCFFESDPTDESIKKMIANAKDEGMQLIYFVSSDTIQAHDVMKQQEAILGMLTQETRLFNVMRVVRCNYLSILNNIAAKINSKLGGLTKLVKGDQMIEPWISEANKLYIAFDFTVAIDEENESKKPITIGFGANISVKSQFFTGGYRYVDSESSNAMKKELKDICKNLISQKCKILEEGNPLTNLIIYFADITNDGIELVTNTYLTEIRDACKENECNPKITLIASTPLDSNLDISQYRDFIIDIPIRLASTISIKYMKYFILHDENELEINCIKKFTRALCGMHNERFKPATPAPIVTAEESVKRGINNFLETNKKKIISLEEANELLCNLEKNFGKLRFNA